jgi:hypothetical protein
VQTHQRRAWQRRAEAGIEDVGDRTHAQGAGSQDAERIRLDSVEPQGARSLVFRAPREQDERSVGRAQAANRVRDRCGGRAVEPLDVVDREQYGRAGGEGAQRGQEGNRDRLRARRRSRRLLPEEHDRECAALRGGKLVGELVEDIAHEVAKRGEREPGLRSVSCRGEDDQTASPGLLDARTPERRLADSRFALEQQDVRTFVRRVRKFADRRKLAISAYYRGHTRSIARPRLLWKGALARAGRSREALRSART